MMDDAQVEYPPRGSPEQERAWTREWERRHEAIGARNARWRARHPSARPYNYLRLETFLKRRRLAAWLRKNRPHQHGTGSCYTNDGCRCWSCKWAHMMQLREYRTRRASNT